MDNNHSNFLKVGLSAVKAAEEIILNYYHSTSNRINIKDDNTPVSDADIEAQKIIVDILKKNFPNHFFLGEENPTVDSLAEKEYVWIIDPIDGTKNYLHGIPLFGTDVA
jgi:fructose-1,6-bisphosphatase/inositol monophosphatase family enzyme